MLTYDPKMRPSATECLQDIWILKYARRRVSANDIHYTMQHLRGFKAASLIHKAILSFIVTYVMTKEREKKVREIFDVLDANKDGKLSTDELLAGFSLLLGGDMVKARAETKKVMRKIDLNKNGSIDYNGFLYNERI